MKVCGVSFGKNVVKYDYPIKEAITSILPICDEFVVAVGESEDSSLDLINSIASDKLKIIETRWNENLREGGEVLADETNKALKKVPKDCDWIFYIQGDEVVHEKYLSVVKNAMEEHLNNPNVDGLLFKYKHFYGGYNYIGNSYRWYSNEIRVIRNRPDIYSYKDAQGFRKGDNQKLNVIPIDAYIYHYGWVKDPITQQEKQKTFQGLWHDEKTIEKHVDKSENEFDYSEIDSLLEFKESHPKVMIPRVKNQDWKFEFDTTKIKISFKNKIKRTIEKLLGFQLGEYKNYTIYETKHP